MLKVGDLSILDVIQASIGRWHQILPAFGIENKYLSGKHTPCPMCGGHDRYRWDNLRGKGTFICSSCGAGDGMQLLMKYTGRDFKELANEVRGMLGETTEAKIPQEKEVDKEKLRATFRRIYKESVKGKNHLYLRSRGIQSDPDVIYHKAMPYYEDGKKVGDFPCLIGVIKNMQGQAIGMHRIYLNSFGKDKANVKTPKKMMPLLEDSNGCAIQLYECEEVLGIAEGIETACAAYELTGIPTWSTVNTAIMEKFEPPERVKKLVIFGDNDANYSGQKAAYTLAKKLAVKGLDVEVKIPNVIGDFNDVLLRKLESEVK